MTAPKLTERSDGGWEVRWYCDPPPPGTTYLIVRDRWDCAGGTARVRSVYEIRITGTADG